MLPRLYLLLAVDFLVLDVLLPIINQILFVKQPTSKIMYHVPMALLYPIKQLWLKKNHLAAASRIHILFVRFGATGPQKNICLYAGFPYTMYHARKQRCIYGQTICTLVCHMCCFPCHRSCYRCTTNSPANFITSMTDILMYVTMTYWMWDQDGAILCHDIVVVRHWQFCNILRHAQYNAVWNGLVRLQLAIDTVVYGKERGMQMWNI